MKQGVRFFVKPSSFVNQLQWSSHHSWILFAFLVIAGIEAHIGKQQGVYYSYAQIFSNRTGLGVDFSMWLVVAAKLFLTLVGSSLIALGTWFVGSYLGHSSSQRVLFRRMAVVFTLALAAYTAQHLDRFYPWMGTVSLFLYFWSALLGYFTFREQFGLTHLESAFVSLFAFLMVCTSWHYSNVFLEKSARVYMSELAAKTSMSQPVIPNKKVH